MCTEDREKWWRPLWRSWVSSPQSRVTRVGVTDLPECGTNDEVLAHHRLDVASLVQKFRGALRQNPAGLHDDRRATQLT